MTATKAPHIEGAPEPQPTEPGSKPSESAGWMGGLIDRSGNYMADNPVKSTIALTIAGGVAKERIIDPLLDKTIDFAKGFFAAGAEQQVNEKIADEAVAHATGAIIDSIVSRAFEGVVD